MLFDILACYERFFQLDSYHFAFWFVVPFYHQSFEEINHFKEKSFFGFYW
jgi:hypothetical protein